jgi:hypothetical protein
MDYLNSLEKTNSDITLERRSSQQGTPQQNLKAFDKQYDKEIQALKYTKVHKRPYIVGVSSIVILDLRRSGMWEDQDNKASPYQLEEFNNIN